MLRRRVAVLAATLLLLKVHNSTSSGSAGPEHRQVVSLQPTRRQRDRDQEEDDADPRHPRYPNHRTRRKTLPAEDALGVYPQMGKFEPRHRTGIVVSRDRCAAEERWDEMEESWMTTLAALAASGTALALQAAPEGGRRQHRRRRQRRRPPDISSAAAAAVQRLQAELSSRLDILSTWSRQRRRSMFPPPAARRRRRRSVPPFSPHQASAAAVLAARQHLGQLRAHVLGMTAAAGRRTEALLLAARESGDRGLRITGGCGELLRQRGRGLLVQSVGRLKRGAGGAGRQLQEEEAEEGEWEGSRLVRLTDMTVQNVVDVVARDGWEHVATTSGVVVHRQYIALGPDGTPIEEDTAAAAAGAEEAGAGATVEPSAVVGGSGSSSSSSSSSSSASNDKSPRFACVKATAVISVPPEVVYLLFADNSRVSEYNEHCREVKDLEVLSQDSKITWAASGRMGPFKVRGWCV